MMSTPTITGTVLCNARYMNIRGQDCLVNLADPLYLDTNYDPASGNDNGTTYPDLSGVSSIAGFDSTVTKFSEKSLFFQNYYANYYYITEPSYVTTFTNLTI